MSDNPDQLKFVNLYERPDVRQESTPQFVYKRQQLTNIAVPFRGACIGASATRKSLTVIQVLLMHMACFHTLYILAKNLNEPLYRWIINNRAKLGLKQVFACDDLQMFDQLWSEANHDPQRMKAVIVDDMLTCSAKVPDSVLELFNMGRKTGWSAVFISSSWFAIDPKVRGCIDIKILKRVNDEDTVARMLHGSGLTRDAVRLYKFVVSDPDRAFIIDDANSNPAMRFRCNYRPISMGDIAEPQLALTGLKGSGAKRRKTKLDRLADEGARTPMPLLIEQVAE